MKTTLHFFAVMLTLFALVLYSNKVMAQVEPPFIPEDPLNEPFSENWTFVENAGQVYDLGGNFRDDVSYVSLGTNPSVYVAKNNKLAVVLRKFNNDVNIPDSLFRIDVSLTGEAVQPTVPIMLEEVACKYNFYQEYTPEGVTGVTGGKRIFYKGVYPYTDMHVLSTIDGPKILIVVRPGGNPNDILLQFEGQDSLNKDTQQLLSVWFKQRNFKLAQGQAYQQTGGVTNYVPWAANYVHQHGSSLVSFQLGQYDPTKPLILNIRPLFSPLGAPPPPAGDLPEWSSFFAGSGADAIRDLDHDEFGNTFFTGNSFSSTGFPIFPSAQQPANAGGSDIIVGRINRWYEMQQGSGAWMTYLGNSGTQTCRAISYDPLYQRVAVCSEFDFSFSGLPNTPIASNPNCYQGQGSGIVAWLGTSGITDGRVIYTTRLHFDALLTDVDHDAEGNLYVIANAQLGQEYVNPPGSAEYFDGYHTEENSTARSLVISKFTPQADLVWSTQFGGLRDDQGHRCHVDEYSNRLFVVGQTQTANGNTQRGPNGWSGFPLCNAGGWYQNRVNGNIQGQTDFYDGFIASFDLTTLALTWSSFFGGNETDAITDVTTDENGNIYIAGFARTGSYNAISCAWDNFEHYFPQCNSGGYFDSNGGLGQDNFIAKFSSTTEMAWCTKIGGGWREGDGDTRLSYDSSTGTIFLFGTTNSGQGSFAPFPIHLDPAFYGQGNLRDPGLITTGATDTYVLGFDPQDQIIYATYFGGLGSDVSGAIDVHNGKVFIAGSTYASTQFPLHCPDLPGHIPYCNSTPTSTANSADGFISQIKYDYTIGLNEVSAATGGELSCIPNPSNGQVRLQCSGGCAGMQLTVTNVTGQLVMQSRVTEASPSLSLNGLSKGLYVIQGVNKNSVVYRTRLLVE